ncbi:MAG TPA: response regulator transcription factor [Gemmatimonadaceae bacterium]|nr:response regulator transcription factor [Gemmatimonadaceae bacterium]
MSRILVVEDNVDLAYGLLNNLEIEGYAVELAHDGRAGLALALERPFDLIILDLMIPGLDGLRVLKALRESENRTPVLVLTARGQEEDKVRGLRLGADDYVTKPFGVLELLARIEALLRRTQPAQAVGPPVGFGDVVVDPASRTVRRGGVEIPLSPKEFDLLWALVDANGAAVSRDHLMERVWGYGADVLSRTVDTHIAELRRKLETGASAPAHILTVRKIGYRLVRA